MADLINVADFARIIRRCAFNLHSATIVGLSPHLKAMGNRVNNPRIGDLVVEITTRFRDNDLDAVGHLEKVAREPVQYEVPWDEEAEGEPCPTEMVYYIRTFDGRSFRWTNASLIAVLTDLQ